MSDSFFSEAGVSRRAWFERTALLAGAAALAGSTACSQAPEQQTKAGEAPGGAIARLLPGFQQERVKTSGAEINTVRAGSGPPLLLLHGSPQTLVTWHKVAPELAKEYTVIAADLRGYGDSSKPEAGENHANYSKRAMAQDQVEVMQHFGFEKFALLGHDRGARVGHRLALDHPDRLTKAAFLDIVPTHHIYNNVTREFSTNYYHFFFFIQPAPFPETLLGNNIDFFMGEPKSDAEREYLRCIKAPGTLHSMLEDYRAAASIDLEHDEASRDQKIQCPLLVLWALQGSISPAQRDPIRPMGVMFDAANTWKQYAANVTGKGLPCGHLIQEALPEETLAEVRAFLKA